MGAAAAGGAPAYSGADEAVDGKVLIGTGSVGMSAIMSVNVCVCVCVCVCDVNTSERTKIKYVEEYGYKCKTCGRSTHRFAT